MVAKEPERFILIVEDDPIVASFLRDVVEEVGVVRTTDYARLHRRLSERRYDAAVVGLDSTHSKPLAVIGLLRACRLPVVAYSALSVTEPKEPAMRDVHIVAAPKRDAEINETLYRLLRAEHEQRGLTVLTAYRDLSGASH